MPPFLRALVALAGAAGLYAQADLPLHNVPERLARWKPVDMPFHAETLSARERQMVGKLVDACRLLNSVYWRQSDTPGLAIDKATKNSALKSLFSIMGSRWDLLDENRP